MPWLAPPPARSVRARAPESLSAGFSIRTAPIGVRRFSTAEWTLDLDRTYENPFDPRQVDLTAEFVSDQGSRRTVRGFYWQGFTRALVDGREALTPSGRPAWKIRFTPDRPGAWRYRLLLRDPLLHPAVNGRLRVSPSRDPGFVRRAERSPLHLRYDDGTPYFVVGENMAWPGRRGTYDYDDWFAALGGAGGNWARVWLTHDHLGLEWTAGGGGFGAGNGLGRYSLENAWRIDRILERARSAGVRLMLTLGTYSELKSDPGYFHEEAWGANPYNAANGGPCGTRADFFTDRTARELYRRKLRYIVARFGSRTAVQSWEFFNETDAPAAWVAEMSTALRAEDPYHHLISTTYGNEAVWRLPTLDFTQSHTYGEDGSAPDSAPVIVGLNRDLTARYRKPHLVSEFGIDWKAGDEKYDPTGLAINMHNGLWSSAMSDGMGGAAIWWWDGYVHPLGLYSEFRSLARFAARVPWASGDWRPLDVPPPVAPQATDRYVDAELPATFGWGKPPGGALYRVGPAGQFDGGPIPQYLYSRGKASLRTTPEFVTDSPRPTRFSVHVASVMTGGRLRVRVDGAVGLDQSLPAGPGSGPWRSSQLQPQWNTYLARYDRDFGVLVPAGRHRIRVENAEGDWIQVSGYRLSGYRSSRYPPIRVIGLRSGRMAVLWVQDEGSTWVNARRAAVPRLWSGVRIRILGLPSGRYHVTWWDTRKGEPAGAENLLAGAGGLSLRLPPFRRDVAVEVSGAGAPPGHGMGRTR